VHGPEVNLHVAALLPEDYLPDVHLRLIHYKRIANAADAEALAEMQMELIDRYGPLPSAAKILFRITRIKLTAAIPGIRKIEADSTGGYIEFESEPRIDPRFLVELVESESEVFSLDRKQRLRFSQPMGEGEIRLDISEQVIGRLAEHLSDEEIPAKSA
jgi:transcription-repair coupling factor (superfamily II helicase)